MHGCTQTMDGNTQQNLEQITQSEAAEYDIGSLMVSFYNNSINVHRYMVLDH